MRNSFIENLKVAATSDQNIQLLVGDLGYSVVEGFQDELPKQFHNIGVAEQNMIGVAAGMSHQGLKPFCYSIANFPLFRPAEFVRNLIDYHCLNVSIVAVGGGLAYGNLGYTHHAVQDFSFVNSLLNFMVCAPADPSQVPFILDYCLNSKVPKYVRLNRNGEERIEWNVIKDRGLIFFSNKKQFNQEKSLIISTGISGNFIENYLFRSQRLKTKFPTLHFNLPIWGGEVSAQCRDLISQFDEVYVFEDHVSHGGFGDWLRNISRHPRVVKFSLVDDFVGQVGTQDFFFKAFMAKLESSHD